MDEIIQRIKLIIIADGAGIMEIMKIIKLIIKINKNVIFLLNTIQIILKFFQMLFL